MRFIQSNFFLHIITSAKLSLDSSLTFTGKDKKGVDALAKAWAVSNGVPVETYKADWASYGRGAGHRRNAEMVTASDFVLILWDGSSTGTKNDIDLCKKNYKNYKGTK